jgi:putative ABC transport system permease protein
VLLVSAGLLLRSMRVLFAIDPGFNTSNLLTMQVQTSGRRFDKDTTDRFFAQALERVRALPAVEAAALTSQLPLSVDDDEYGASFEGDDPNAAYNVFRYAVSPGYFEATGIPLRRGRLLDTHDVAGAPRAVLISESLAEHKFQGRDPIGQRLHIGPRNEPWYTIVGVVGNIKQTSLAANQPDAAYITTSQSSFVDTALSLVIRTRGDTGALTRAVQNAIWSVDKDQPITRIATMDQLLVTTAAERRFALILFDLFGIVALVMAATGIYGVLTASVNERIREIGVRLALGAQRSDVLTLVLRQGVTMIVCGVGIGLCGAWAATRLLRRLLFGISASDPLTFTMVALLLMLVALVACYIPARRATKVDPLVALRFE